jgi:hypothetical protein
MTQRYYAGYTNARAGIARVYDHQAQRFLPGSYTLPEAIAVKRAMAATEPAVAVRPAWLYG